ncbi:unnamed protein product, partial [Discosporangium mesarthrocarpum]
LDGEQEGQHQASQVIQEKTEEVLRAFSELGQRAGDSITGMKDIFGRKAADGKHSEWNSASEGTEVGLQPLSGGGSLGATVTGPYTATTTTQSTSSSDMTTTTTGGWDLFKHPAVEDWKKRLEMATGGGMDKPGPSPTKKGDFRAAQGSSGSGGGHGVESRRGTTGNLPSDITTSATSATGGPRGATRAGDDGSPLPWGKVGDSLRDLRRRSQEAMREVVSNLKTALDDNSDSGESDGEEWGQQGRKAKEKEESEKDSSGRSTRAGMMALGGGGQEGNSRKGSSIGSPQVAIGGTLMAAQGNRTAGRNEGHVVEADGPHGRGKGRGSGVEPLPTDDFWNPFYEMEEEDLTAAVPLPKEQWGDRIGGSVGSRK